MSDGRLVGAEGVEGCIGGLVVLLSALLMLWALVLFLV